MNPSPFFLQTANLQPVLHRLDQLRILVIGDLMLDQYLWGRVTRISPEAPVPVVDVQQEENRLGGAANVALNLRALGVTPILCGTLGLDHEGKLFQQVLADCSLSAEGLVELADRRTTTKIRVLGQHQQMLRVDKEDSSPLPPNLRHWVQTRLLALLETPLDAVIFEDYDKGLLGPELIQLVVEACKRKKLMVSVDPKLRNFFHYGGCTLFKPNLKELNEALKTNIARNDFPAIAAGIQQLRQQMPHQISMVTLSEFGLLMVDEQGAVTHVPAHYRQIVDVSGAGDTVISVMAALMTAGLPLADAAQAANLAGGLVCEEVGVVPIKKDSLLQELHKLPLAPQA